MAIPDYQKIFLPFLNLAGDGNEHSIGDARKELATHFNLTEDEVREMLPSGNQKIFHNRVGWAQTYLKKAGLIEYTGRGIFKITERGREVLDNKPEQINVRFLKQFSEFNDFHRVQRGTATKEAEPATEEENRTPEEAIEYGYKRLRDDLANELLTKIISLSPDFFEKLVVELLVGMGYGGSRSDAGQSIGGVGDSGIDGIIKEDRLGLDTIYIQAKRYNQGNTVGRPDIQKFAGALQGHRAKKGVFITTSSFTKEAHDYTSNIDTKIVLIDGPKLAGLMIDTSLGVSTEETYEIKRIDSDYFAEE